MKLEKTRRKITLSNATFKWVFDTFPYGIIVCDQAETIVQVNAAALKLFEVASASLCIGSSYQQFLHRYEGEKQRQRIDNLEPWLMKLIIYEQEACKVLQVPSGHTIIVTTELVPLLDAQQQVMGTLCVFHDITHHYQKALQLQRAHRSVLKLTETIAHLPEHLPFTFTAQSFLVSPVVLSIAQQLVVVIGDVLNCQHVRLVALEPETNYVRYLAGYGLTPEEEQAHQKCSGSSLPSAFFDASTLAALTANQKVILPSLQLPLPPELQTSGQDELVLLIPLFFEHQLTGALSIARTGLDGTYASEEIEFAEFVATETVGFITCLYALYIQTEAQARVQAQQEMYHHLDAFLNLASHEFKTPLTIIKGNVQLAQRRLMKLHPQATGLSEHVSEQIEVVQSLLAKAVESTRLYESMIQTMLTDQQLQNRALTLNLERCDLAALLKETITRQRQGAPEHVITLQIMPDNQVIPVMADAERICQAIKAYLTNALHYSAPDQPITVQLTVESAKACVAVHDDGPGIPLEEQAYIWQHFPYNRYINGQRELAISLELHLCKELIECHHGSVGVQSNPGQGTTFWFVLPLVTAVT